MIPRNSQTAVRTPTPDDSVIGNQGGRHEVTGHQQGVPFDTKPSLEDQLAAAENDLLRADYTDSFAKMQREKNDARERIAKIKRLIADRDARLHVEGAR